jgi:hypothetical protein
MQIYSMAIREKQALSKTFFSKTGALENRRST